MPPDDVDPNAPVPFTPATTPEANKTDTPVVPPTPPQADKTEAVITAPNSSSVLTPEGAPKATAVLEAMAAGEKDEIKPIVKRKTLSIIIHDAGVLRAAYMQFVKGGGLFIPTKKNFNMGEDTNLVIRLLDEEEPYRVSGKVCWITPSGGTSNRAGGIGVEFAEDKNGERLRNRIEVILGPYLKSTEGTHTM